MQITEEQRDTLAEVINIAFGRTAASLSRLTGQRVLLDPPTVHITPLDHLGVVLHDLAAVDVATVHQVFSGPANGTALLVLDQPGAITLVRLLTGESTPADRLSASEREALAEIGNILLNACLSTFGNLLRVRFAFSVPLLQLEALETMLDTLVIESRELSYTLVASANFRLQDGQVAGYLVIVLGVTSLEQLLAATEAWAQRQLAGGVQ